MKIGTALCDDVAMADERRRPYWDTDPPEQPTSTVPQGYGPTGPSPETAPEEVTNCYGHPKVPTKLRCSRCDRPICGRCAIPATVGQHCPECVADARRSAPKVRSQMMSTAPAVMTILAVNVVM